VSFAGWLLAACAVVYNPVSITLVVRLVSKAFHRPWMEAPDAGHVLWMELWLAVAAVVLLVAVRPLARRAGRGAGRVVVALLVVLVPLFTLEVVLRPFADRLSKETSLFVADRELCWKLRPDAVEPWGDITVTINSRGLRGPVVPYERRSGTPRVLYLGDSVTFGYNVARWEDTFPFVVGRTLASELGTDVETINTGVGGYSPWQESAYLRREGIRYAPDAVVVDFVLNDVTEKFTLTRFGGYGLGRQLTQSYYSPLDHVLARSGLGYHLRWVWNRIVSRRVHASSPRIHAIHYGPLDVKALIRNPDAPYLSGAWEITFEHLDSIFAFCNERHVPALLVVFPFAKQLADPDSTSGPQRRVVAHAEARGVPCVDLLPELADYARAHGLTTDDLFLDQDHLSVEGHKVVAELLAPRIRALIGD